MKKTLSILLFLISIAVYSQQKALELTNNKTGKIISYKENQRVKIRTLAGKKMIGKLTFSDMETVLINQTAIKLDSVQSIKNQPRSLGTIKTIVLSTGLAVIGSSLIAGAKGNNSAFLLFTIGSGITISSSLFDGKNKSNSNRKWKFKIIEK